MTHENAVLKGLEAMREYDRHGGGGCRTPKTGKIIRLMK